MGAWRPAGGAQGAASRANKPGTGPPAGHAATEGPTLSAETIESVHAGARCTSDAPVREFAVVAINVEITLNRFLDFDPQGRMYVLADDLPRVRQEEAQNRAARAGQGEPGVSIGLQGDASQPLTVRVNQGDCLDITLRNDLGSGEPASLHLHGSAAYVAGLGQSAIATNRAATADSGQTVEYQWPRKFFSLEAVEAPLPILGH